MTGDAQIKNPVAEMLSRKAAPDLIGGIRPPHLGAGPVHVEYGQGKPTALNLTGPIVQLAIAGIVLLIGVIITINVVASGNYDLNNVMGIILPLFIAIFIGAPALGRALKGTLYWTRRAAIHPDRVEVVDNSSGTEIRWSAPISEYRDIYHGFMWLTAGDGEGDGLDIEAVMLRHPDQSKTIYVSGTRKTTMGGMNFMDMVQAGREGRKADVEAAVGDTRNPQIEALVAHLAQETGLRVTTDFK
ncbi:hypothetical protein V8J82_00395 [Gymnodinialimonas sp. 2305UL16-5]|uniref:hypothetical protein n=1 Tax=Gymnodinialimonas mytili TaxID=3126503 RepID=UPI0030B3D099